VATSKDLSLAVIVLMTRRIAQLRVSLLVLWCKAAIFFLFTPTSVAGFVSPSKCFTTRKFSVILDSSKTLLLLSSIDPLNSYEFTDAEVSEMESLILTLSKISADDSRRGRVAAIFEETFATDSSHESISNQQLDAKRFCHLFDKVLIRVGDQVQQQAAAAKPLPSDVGAITSDDDSSGASGERTKTKEELQLWALVDMMVQSKTIIKRASGELGKDGVFG
jgi:hypothetical protein